MNELDCLYAATEMAEKNGWSDWEMMNYYYDLLILWNVQKAPSFTPKKRPNKYAEQEQIAKLKEQRDKTYARIEKLKLAKAKADERLEKARIAEEKARIEYERELAKEH